MQAYERVLAFWFSDEVQPLWFAKNADFDQKIIEDFGKIHELAVSDKFSSWQSHIRGALSLIILLDQFSRNIYRDQKQAFAYDEKALLVSEHVINQGNDTLLDVKERVFLYIPFMHSELLSDQEKSVELYRSLGLEINLKFAIEHRDIIARFGRFPHRNKILGRDSTDEEKLFLEKEHQGF